MVRVGVVWAGAGAFLLDVLAWPGDARAQSTAAFPSDPPPASAAPPPAPPPPAVTSEPPPGAAPPPPPGAATGEPSAPASPPPAAPAPVAPVIVSPAEVPPNEPPAPPEKPPEPVRYVSATFSPLHLFQPIFEADVEAMLIPHLGISLIGGIGKVSIDSPDPSIDGETLDAYELGAHVIGYPLKDFSSLQLGAEILWIKVSVDNYQGTDVSGTGAGIAFGPFVGYKFIADIGFTLYVQGGFQYLKIEAEAHDSQGNSESAEDDQFIPLLNFNLGWSF
jgi:hypothetical protein